MEIIYNTYDESDWAWEDFVYDITYFDKYLGKKAYVKGRNLDWRGAEGTAEFILEDSKDMLWKLVPENTD
mgnify:FL=1